MFVSPSCPLDTLKGKKSKSNLKERKVFASEEVAGYQQPVPTCQKVKNVPTNQSVIFVQLFNAIISLGLVVSTSIIWGTSDYKFNHVKVIPVFAVNFL